MAPNSDVTITPTPSPEMRQIWCAFKCDNCGALSVATATGLNNNPLVTRNPLAWIDQITDQEWYPIHAVAKQFPDVPPHIGEAASEAYLCRSISAFRAAIQLARSVVEATAKEKGITQGRLVQKIDQLFDQGLIRQYVREGAHEIRHLGNDMAHGDFIDPVTSEETDLALTLMSEILDEVFQSPARVAKAQAARAARNISAAQPELPPTSQGADA